MTATVASVQIISSHASFEPLVDGVLSKAGVIRSAHFGRGVAKVILDFPLTYAFAQLESLNSFERARTVVCTQSNNAAYLDCLGSYHLSAVVSSTDGKGLLSAVYAASDAQRIYQYLSGLTYMELRVTRLLLLGDDTRRLARKLQISHKTVNAHISNILGKLGYESRAQYLAALLGNKATA